MMVLCNPILYTDGLELKEFYSIDKMILNKVQINGSQSVLDVFPVRDIYQNVESLLPDLKVKHVYRVLTNYIYILYENNDLYQIDHDVLTKVDISALDSILIPGQIQHRSNTKKAI